MSLPTTEAAVRMKPALNNAEIDMYSVILAKTRTLLEFGDAGSTLLAVRHRVKKIYSVKSSPEQIAELRKIGQIVEAEREGRLEFFQPEIGRCNRKGKPVDRKNQDAWPAYFTDVWGHLGDVVPDVLYINGFYTLAASMEALKHIGNGTQVMLYGPHRLRRVDQLKEYYEFTNIVQNLAVMRRKSSWDPERHLAEVQDIIEQVKYKPRT
ncbi:hypothetical protein [Spirochaeta dissipatitropha]